LARKKLKVIKSKILLNNLLVNLINHKVVAYALRISPAVVLLLAIVVFILLSPCFFHDTHAIVKTITVPDDYNTIQSAIENAAAGDIIYVRNGIYSEKIVVDQPVSLVGENERTTIIDGGGTGSAIQVFANNVEIANLTIKNAGTSPWFGHGFPESCIDVENIDNLTVVNNIISNGTVGIWSYSSTKATVARNLVSNTTTMGVAYYACMNSAIDNNILQNCGIVGIHLDGNSSKCEIVNNTVTNCLEGIEIEKSSGNTLRENSMLSNDEGLAFSDSNETSIDFCSIENNRVGVKFYQSNNENSFSHNSFINNVQQVAFDSTSSNSADVSVNSWDNGKDGNYWSDYQTKYFNASEIGSTGIGNTPYFIDANNIDHYPLMAPAPVSEFRTWAIPLLLAATALPIAVVRKVKKMR